MKIIKLNIKEMEELIETYKTYKPTESCYLNGQYFNIVLADYPGLIEEPLNVYINDDETVEIDQSDELFEDLQMIGSVKLNRTSKYDKTDYFYLLRVILHKADGISHSNLLLIDPVDKVIYRFEPLHHYKDDKHHHKLMYKLISESLLKYFKTELPGYKFKELPLHPQHHHHKHLFEKCEQIGYCNAFVIKLGVLVSLDLDLGLIQELERHDILRFASAVENIYGPLEEGDSEDEVEEEYGFFKKKEKEKKEPQRAYGGNPMKSGPKYLDPRRKH